VPGAGRENIASRHENFNFSLFSWAHHIFYLIGKLSNSFLARFS
jgi:hypothetical protein